MGQTHPRDIGLGQARALVSRAVDKAEQLGLHGSISVVGASGALVTASRLDRGGLGGSGRATSKAWIAATQQIPSTEHLHRMTTLPAPISAGFTAISPQAAFPGGGGLPIRDEEGAVIGGIAASGATVSPFFPDGVAPEDLSVAGQPANPEDLLIAYALGVPYVSQHGDDQPRWVARFGELSLDAEQSRGAAPAPASSRQAELSWAIELANRAMAAAASRGVLISVAVVDRGGDPVQQDRMDDGAAAGVECALALATTAARFGTPSEQVAIDFGPATDSLAGLHPAAFLAAPGGLPLRVDGRLVGGLAVAGIDPQVCADLVSQVVSA